MGACVWLAGLAARAQTAPPPEPAPPAAPSEPTPPAAPSEPTPRSPPPSAPAPIAPAPPTAAAPPTAPPPPPAYAYPPPTYASPPPAYASPPPPYAYPPPPYAYPPPPPQWYAPPPPLPGGPAAVVSVAAPRPGSARLPAEDPQADRGIVLPTAYTHPKGTFFVSDYDLAIVQIGYAFTDDTQISFTGVPPLGDERVAFVDFTLKTTLYRGGLVRVAALGSTSGLVANEIGVAAIGRVGGVVQLCLEARCLSSLSITSDITLAGTMLMVNGANGIFHMSRSLSLLAELDTLLPLGTAAAEFNGAMAGGGLRFHWAHAGFDLTLMHVLGGSHATLPIFAFTYRT
ncbi:MAG TPA: hypothetical protein VLA14_11720 [Polyangia bacterium]|nr:hypothetical protein [Polyangia bacterium]